MASKVESKLSDTGQLHTIHYCCCIAPRQDRQTDRHALANISFACNTRDYSCKYYFSYGVMVL